MSSVNNNGILKFNPGLQIIAGTINLKDVNKFQRVIFRSTKGNCLSFIETDFDEEAKKELEKYY